MQMRLYPIRFFLVLFSIVFIQTTTAQSQSLLNSYIEEGLKANIALSQETLEIERAMIQLQNASSLFYPTVAFNGSFTSGEGGRFFNFPLGDIVNPVYSTLNQLTSSNAFPQIENAEAFLNPKNFYDAHIRTSMPLLNTDIIYNKRIQKSQVEARAEGLMIYKRELVKQIKTAYFQYAQSVKAIDVYTSALGLIERTEIITQSLVKNGKAIPAQLSRIEAEKAKIEAELNTAQNQSENAKAFFNFLINRPLDSVVEVETSAKPLVAAPSDSFKNREELKLLEKVLLIQQTALQMERAYAVPRLSAFVDLGSQAEQWRVDEKSRYYLLGVQMDIPIFEAGRNTRNSKLAEIQVKDAQLELENTQKQLQLAITVANNNVRSELDKLESSKQLQTAAESYYAAMESGFKAGVTPLIDYLDARTQLTNASLSVIIQELKLAEAIAQLERETATDIINK
jgi:outer membrane protein TolC